MINVSLENRKIRQRLWLLLFFGICVSAPSFAQGGGAITEAADSIKQYWRPLKNLIMMIGGIVGLMGGLRIYNKWTNGDQDINKEILGWGGACLFLILVHVFISALFNIK